MTKTNYLIKRYCKKNVETMQNAKIVAFARCQLSKEGGEGGRERGRGREGKREHSEQSSNSICSHSSDGLTIGSMVRR